MDLQATDPLAKNLWIDYFMSSQKEVLRGKRGRDAFLTYARRIFLKTGKRFMSQAQFETR